ncbi:MAG: hypothetical protein J7545_19160 [Roseofilum sp. SBFL]|nr:hypothetical protein [Roseofilum sp. SBFL]MBP0044063.1 hypothetical protein [Roseofilum sp. SBFL]
MSLPKTNEKFCEITRIYVDTIEEFNLTVVLFPEELTRESNYGRIYRQQP